MRRSVCLRSLVCAVVLLAAPVAAFAQSKGTVVVDGAIIWRSDASVPASVVSAGTVLELTARSERWYEVIIPENLGGRGDRGLIAVGQVKLIEGSEPPPTRALRGSPPAAPQLQPRFPPRAAAIAEPEVALRAFGQAGLRTFTAHHSFEAILGEPRGPIFGGGLQLRFRPGLFIQAGLERFRKTGQRVFVLDGSVFPLGIPDTITIDAIGLSAGYRLPLKGGVLPYTGGGISMYRLREVSRFDDPAERVRVRKVGYHALGGAEFRTTRWLAIAGELTYSIMPHALGTTGVSAEFGEHDLGGWQLQVKVLVGR
jgi:hypothetical protein